MHLLDSKTSVTQAAQLEWLRTDWLYDVVVKKPEPLWRVKCLSLVSQVRLPTSVPYFAFVRTLVQCRTYWRYAHRPGGNGLH